MTQNSTRRDLHYTLPGTLATYPRETESMEVPITRQTIRVTAGPDDPVAAGDYNIVLRVPNGPLVTLATPYTSPGEAAATFATNFAAAMQADPAFRSRWVQDPIVAAGLNIDLTSISSLLDYQIVSVTQPAGSNVSAAVLTPGGGASLPIGRIYAYAALAAAPGNAIQGNHRRARPARPLQVGDTLAHLRGLVGRETLAPTQGADFFNPSGDPDAYPPNTVFVGLTRGDGDVEVDPASANIGDAYLASVGAPALYVVLAAGLNSRVGALTTVVDGGNTLQVNAGADPFIRPTMPEPTLPTGIGTQSIRAVRIKLNRTS